MVPSPLLGELPHREFGQYPSMSRCSRPKLGALWSHSVVKLKYWKVWRTWLWSNCLGQTSAATTGHSISTGEPGPPCRIDGECSVDQHYDTDLNFARERGLGGNCRCACGLHCDSRCSAVTSAWIRRLHALTGQIFLVTVMAEWISMPR